MSKKTVNYRKAEIILKDDQPATETLQELFEKALQSPKLTPPFKFRHDIGDSKTSFLLLFTKGNGTPYRREHCTCGCISFYDEDMTVPLIDSEIVNDEIFTESVMPIDSKGKKRNLEQDTIYFAIRKNHVALVISNFHGISIFTDFLYTLLQDETETLKDASIRLINIPTKEARKKIQNSDVKSFTFSTSAYQTEKIKLTAQEREECKREGKAKRIKTICKNSELLNAILKTFKADAILKDLTEKDDLGKLSISIEFSYQSKKNEKGQNVLNDFAHHFGELEGLNTVINLGKAGTIKHNELTVKGEVDIASKNKILSKANAYTVIAQWLVKQIETGLV